jgi:hypothetical protein
MLVNILAPNPEKKIPIVLVWCVHLLLVLKRLNFWTALLFRVTTQIVKDVGRSSMVTIGKFFSLVWLTEKAFSQELRLPVGS